jgi:hypothetical protein
MELDRALELSVVSSWGDLVKPGDSCSVHVEYENISHLPLRLLEVWTVRGHGYGTLVCRYSVAANNSNPPPSEDPAICFANSYHSQLLADSLRFIIRNQDRFTRPSDRSIHGLVQIDRLSEEDRTDARTWNQTVLTEYSQTVWN